MKLIRFSRNEGQDIRLGRLDDETVTDLTDAGFGTSMRALLDRLQGDFAPLAGVTGETLPLAEVTLHAPIDDPQKFLALGMNYKDHADKAREAGIKVPDTQIWFNKQVSCIADPTGAIELPKVSDRLDYEAELAVVIGKTCRHVSEADALSVIGGYMVGNDVSVRDWQLRSPTFTLGKSFDTHGPLGPWLTTADAVADPQKLAIRAWVNGEIRQDSSTALMIYSIAQQIAYISQAFTLMPGDVLLTGTPAGVGIEHDTFLKIGDVVKIEIEGLGAIENTVVPEG